MSVRSFDFVTVLLCGLPKGIEERKKRGRKKKEKDIRSTQKRDRSKEKEAEEEESLVFILAAIDLSVNHFPLFLLFLILKQYCLTY